MPSRGRKCALFEYSTALVLPKCMQILPVSLGLFPKGRFKQLLKLLELKVYGGGTEETEAGKKKNDNVKQGNITTTLSTNE